VTSLVFSLSLSFFMFLSCSLPHTLVEEKRRKEKKDLGTGERKVIITARILCRQCLTLDEKEYFFFLSSLS
jgi:hypothetical protein